MSDFDDPELARLLGQAGGSYPDVNEAVGQLHRRVRRARRRRTAVAAGSTSVLAVAVVLLLVNMPGQSTERRPAVGSATTASLAPERVPATTTTVQATTTEPSVRPSTPPTTAAATTVVAQSTQSFTGQGGTITVRLQGGSLTLVSYTTASGFTADVRHSAGEEIEVRFESPTHTTRIRVELEDGTMHPQIEEDDEASSEAEEEEEDDGD